MKKLSLTLGAILLLVLIVLPLLLALTTARAGMYQAQANVAQATADTVQAVSTLVGQCLTGVIVVLALVSGIGMGYSLHVWRHPARRHGGAGRKWYPGFHAHGRHAVALRSPQMAAPDWPDPFRSPPPPFIRTPHTHVLTIAGLEADADDEEDFSGGSWGF